MSGFDEQAAAFPREIEIPPDFPVSWKDEHDKQLTWQRNAVHFPEPATPMTYAFGLHTGTDEPMENYEMPIRFRAARINTYFYLAIVPVVPPEQIASQGERSQRNIEEAMGTLGEMWTNEAVPELKKHLEYWKTYDLKKADSGQLLDHFDDTVSRMKRMYEVHHRFTFPWLTAQSMLEDYLRENLPEVDPLDAYKMIGGFPNKSVETEQALWDLSRQILGSEKLRNVLSNIESAEVLKELAVIEEAKPFLHALCEYLDQYGQGICKFYEISNPSWIEDPTPVIESLKECMTSPDRDMRAARESAKKVRIDAVKKVRRLLKNRSKELNERFEFLLKASQEAMVVSEDHNFYIDYCGLYQVRRVLLEIGNRMAKEKTISDPSDIFYLTPDMVRVALRTPEKLDAKHIVAHEKSEMERFGKIEAPAVIGTDYGPPPDDPVSKAFGRLFGGPPIESGERDLIHGSAGSAGKAKGKANVLLSLAEAEKFRRGDVLVAHSTLPPWTPLFANAAAIVTDVGGVLSHAAVVAREYGIPAVVSTGVGTSRIAEGQLIEVDGNAGTVRIL